MAAILRNADLGQKIKKFRNKLKLTQADLASQLGFNSSETISQIERGDREVKAWELAEFSRILSINLNDLFSENESIEPVVLWRQSPNENKEEREAFFLKRCNQYSLLEKLSGLKEGGEFPQKKIPFEKLTYDSVDRIATEIRREFSLGDRPAEQLESTLQNVYGVKIWYLKMDEGSAACTISDFGPAILMNSNEAPWRRNFNFAHEVFHLITWDSIPPVSVIDNPEKWEQIEKYANAFASALLLPSDSLLLESNRRIQNNALSYADLIEIARSFGVSTEALFYRLVNLKKISRRHRDALQNPLFKEIDKASMAPCWWQPDIIPERFIRLAFVAYQKGRLSRAKMCEMLNTSLIDLPDMLEQYGLSDLEGYDAEVRTT